MTAGEAAKGFAWRIEQLREIVSDALWIEVAPDALALPGLLTRHL